MKPRQFYVFAKAMPKRNYARLWFQAY
jgi:hypothetical protein